jgi:hypothetical protein
MLLDFQLSLSLSHFPFHCHSSFRVLEYSSPRSISFGNKVQEALEDNKWVMRMLASLMHMEVTLYIFFVESCNTKS